jgi:S1-C subfamily serine protease
VLAGRDRTTNIAVLRIDSGATVPAGATTTGPGGLVLALGSDGTGGCSVRLGSVEVVGPAWDSQAGGRIDALIRLALRLPGSAEGGPVIDARGRLIGMSTFGPRRSVLVIPAKTVARVIEPLLSQGCIPRGWLGVALQAVALPKELVERSGVGRGLMVVGMADDGPSRNVLLPGDILLAIGATEVASPRDAAAALGPETIGTTLPLRVLRGGEVTTLDVTIAGRPA